MNHDAQIAEPPPIAMAPARPRPVRRSILRGMAVVLPPLLTVVIFLWVGRTLQQYLLEPVTTVAREALVLAISDVRVGLPGGQPTEYPGIFESSGALYQRLDSGEYVPLHVASRVARSPGPPSRLANGAEVYHRYVSLEYLEPYWVTPVFMLVFLGLMYLLGSFLAAGLGRWLWNSVERFIASVPLVRTVYTSVKQVTDLMLSTTQMRVLRVVALQYPRKGSWSFAFVTSDGLRQVDREAGAPTVAIFIPSSPVPMTGFTAFVRQEELVDVNLTVDQVCQFLISCGVVVPPHQQPAKQQTGLKNR